MSCGFSADRPTFKADHTIGFQLHGKLYLSLQTESDMIWKTRRVHVRYILVFGLLQTKNQNVSQTIPHILSNSLQQQKCIFSWYLSVYLSVCLSVTCFPFLGYTGLTHWL